MAQIPSPEKSIFLSAIEMDSAAERAAYLDRACQGIPELRGEIQALLQAHETPRRILDDPVTSVSRLDEPQPSEGPGTVIGPYRLLEQIGEGGFGVVFMAEQTHPVRRKVALKIIKPGMDSPVANQVIARFEAERQALALMDHPNIARVLDAGSTAHESDVQAHGLQSVGMGRPYFVMELVKGIPITEYCDQAQLDTRERLKLFAQVCQAVQHAHQKGIIHRDIKPSNVLVTLHDDVPVPKVIDFGVAKATGEPLTDKSVFTGFAQMIGTPMYMSPEQAGLSDRDVDTRSDIYSLGVLLYELLTGSTPFDKTRFKEVGYDEMRRIIREEEPPKPSARLSTLGMAATTVSTQRRSDPRKLSQLFRGELDWIVMKCLEKDRNRRYETANGLAADVQRYLADEPVQACPPTRWYRVRKYVSRNRSAVLAASLILLALVGGVIGTSWQAARATRERNEREKARQEAAEEAAIARAVNAFLQEDLLAEASPEKNPRNKKVAVEELLDRAAGRIESKFVGQPLVEAAIRQTIGDTYCSLGNYLAAQFHLERAFVINRQVLGEEHDNTLSAMNSLAALYVDLGQTAKAEPLFVNLYEFRRRVLGELHTSTVDSAINLAELYRAQGQLVKAEALLRSALEIRRKVHGEDHPQTVIVMNNLAAVFLGLGKIADAQSLLHKSVEINTRILGDEHLDTLVSMHNLADVYRQQADFVKAEPLLVKVVEVSQLVRGEEHPSTLTAMNNLGALYKEQTQFEKAEKLFEKTLDISRRTLGEEDPNTLLAMNNLATAYSGQGQLDKAETLFVKVLEVSKRVLGEDHPRTLSSMGNLADLYHRQGHLTKAEPIYVNALEGLRRRSLGENPITLGLMDQLATLYRKQRQFTKAEPLYVQAIEGRQRRLGMDHPATFVSINNLAVLYQVQEQFAKAEPLLAQALEGLRRVQGEEHPNTLTSMNGLADVYAAQGQHTKAEPLLRDRLEKVRTRYGETSVQSAAAQTSLARNLLRQSKFADAEPFLRETLTIREKLEPDKWTTFCTTSMLGGSLLGQKRYTDAEPLLITGSQGLMKREADIPGSGKIVVIESVERLMQFFEDTGQPDKAAEWRKKLEERQTPRQ